jgi:hypothetical protein
LLDELHHAAFERFLQPLAVHVRRLGHAAHQPLGGVQGIELPGGMHPQINAADAEGLHLTVQFQVHLVRSGLAAIRADALEAHLFAEQSDLHSLIALRRTQTDAHGTFHWVASFSPCCQRITRIERRGSLPEICFTRSIR